MEKILIGNKVSKYYDTGEVVVKALREVDFEIYDGEFVVILGQSGSGKSTLLNVVGGMDTLTSGSLLYKGIDISKYKDKKLTEYRRNKIGFVFQFYNLIPNLTAFENIQLVTDLVSDPFDISELLSDVGLLERKDHFPSQLSGGEQQRIAIARAISKNPEILLCDEPTGALDFESGLSILRLLKKMNVKYKKTVVIITHNAEIAQIADRVFNLRDGKIISIENIENPVDPEEVKW